LRVFISWSGKESRLIAGGLTTFLQKTLPALSIWMSEKDIPPGGLWKSHLHQRIADADFGIVCVTSTNTTAPWLIYELGCLAMRVPANQLVPVLWGIESADLPEPINSFQAIIGHRQGIQELVAALQRASREPVDSESLAKQFDSNWPSLELCLSGHVTISEVGNIAVITIQQRRLIDEQTIAAFRRRISLILESDRKLLVVDFSNVEFLSSAGFAALLWNRKIAADSGGKLVLARVSPKIREVFKVQKMDRLVEIYDDLPQAIQALNNNSNQTVTERWD
jgi:anti-anti-sigma factor